MLTEQHTGFVDVYRITLGLLMFTEQPLSKQTLGLLMFTKQPLSKQTLGLSMFTEQPLSKQTLGLSMFTEQHWVCRCLQNSPFKTYTGFVDVCLQNYHDGPFLCIPLQYI
jgi:hypothetical protein